MRWLRRQGEPQHEIYKEAAIDFENRKVVFKVRRNQPLKLENAEENCRIGIFDFAEVGGERFDVFLKSVFEGEMDEIFGAGAGGELRNILPLGRAEFAARKLDRKEVIVDCFADGSRREAKFTAPFRIIYRDENYGIVYRSPIAGIPDVSGEYEIYEDFYDRGFMSFGRLPRSSRTRAI